MFDVAIRRALEPALARLASPLADRGVTANQLTLTGAFFAAACGFAIANHYLQVALVLGALSRLCDGLDGTLARQRGSTDVGAFLDLIADYIFYVGVPLGFVVLDASNATASACLLASYVFTAVSFLAYSNLAQQRGISIINDNRRFVFQPGLAEGGETIAVYIAMLIFPAAYATLAYAFAAVCLYTVAARIVLVKQTFRH